MAVLAGVAAGRTGVLSSDYAFVNPVESRLMPSYAGPCGRRSGRSRFAWHLCDPAARLPPRLSMARAARSTVGARRAAKIAAVSWSVGEVVGEGLKPMPRWRERGWRRRCVGRRRTGRRPEGTPARAAALAVPTHPRCTTAMTRGSSV